MHLTFKKKKNVTFLLLALWSLSFIYGSCKMPDKTKNNTDKNSQTIEEPKEMPPSSVWNDIDSMDQTLSSFDTLHANGKVLIKMKTGTKYELIKEATIKFGQRNNEIYFTGTGIVTLTIPKANAKVAMDELKVTLENEAWLHFLANFNGALAMLTVNMQKGLLTGHSVYDLYKFSLMAKDNSLIHLYWMEPTQVLFFDLRDNTKASIQAYKAVSSTLHIKESSFIDSTSSLEAYQTIFKDKLNNALPDGVKQYITYFNKLIPLYTPIPTQYN